MLMLMGNGFNKTSFQRSVPQFGDGRDNIDLEKNGWRCANHSRRRYAVEVIIIFKPGHASNGQPEKGDRSRRGKEVNTAFIARVRDEAIFEHGIHGLRHSGNALASHLIDKRPIRRLYQNDIYRTCGPMGRRVPNSCCRGKDFQGCCGCHYVA